MSIVKELVKGERLERYANQHPCFAVAGNGKPNNKGRIHLPVSPYCNIACRFCSRSTDSEAATELRPGLSAAVLSPVEALEVVERACALSPELTVAGIAGPGDTLASGHALDTFALVKERFPHLLRCMSTNGLLLEESLGRILEVGVHTLTVTVNDIDPQRLTLINDHVIHHGRLYRGDEAAELLIESQLRGIRAAARAGIVIKVNTVLVPGVNDMAIGEIAEAVATAGAALYNIIPLIPNALMADCPAPTCAQLDGARSAAEGRITVFRHCQHCRADAIGVPGGKDYSRQVYADIRQGGAPAPSFENTFSHG
jgi:nitrogen fixation protein NifB